MTYEKFSSDYVAMRLIDHQIGILNWVKSIPFEEIKLNTLIWTDVEIKAIQG